MDYSIRELSGMAGVSARTLRYYDEIGLLKPKYVNEAGYRFYGDEEVALLQQILFYREREFGLQQIRRILYQEDFDVRAAFREHLFYLREQRDRMDALIRTVEHTILAMEGVYEMSDREKFEAFKENVVRENERKYGKEIRERFGDETIDASNRKMLDMGKEEWEQFKGLEDEIYRRLKEGVTAGIGPESEEAKEIVRMHKAWLKRSWKEYDKKAHRALAEAYVADERFRAYYDREVEGCAKLLLDAVCFWVK